MPNSFNSRTREGCDVGDVTSVIEVVVVSIHAPGRGATELFGTENLAQKFQFTHPGGVRRLLRPLALRRTRFQFTHPGGVRLPLVPQLLVGNKVSIHAPGRGATRPLRTLSGASNVSIHAPGRGATLYLLPSFHMRSAFQFTHPGGVRPMGFAVSFDDGAFQFTHPGGVRQ